MLLAGGGNSGGGGGGDGGGGGGGRGQGRPREDMHAFGMPQSEIRTKKEEEEKLAALR